jgi:hypothetical protein
MNPKIVFLNILEFKVNLNPYLIPCFIHFLDLLVNSRSIQLNLTHILYSFIMDFYLINLLNAK